MNDLVLIYTTFANFSEAKAISEKLLDEKLIVCVNILPEASSFYLSEGKISSNCEIVAIMKTKKYYIDKIIEKIESMHSYDQSAIIIIPVEKTNQSFADWINNIISS